ncbi:MAG: type I-E CRISPR-associated protein Cse2/CasB [Gammaproteobacteria bacterium]|nr:type I-E CRISPR-associated protein Cse2/CasB [Gammaproteobacteria bacterium]
MTSPDAPTAEQDSSTQPPTSPISRLAKAIGQAARFPGDVFGMGTGEKAALARMDPDAPRPHQIAALSRALIQAGLEPEQWRPETWKRWALIAHGMALAGHGGREPLGVQLSVAGVAESRITKLLTARADAFFQLIPPLLRLLASKDVSPNWNELGNLILNEGRSETEAQEKAEEIRMKIAGRYFSEKARAAHN